MINEPIMLSLMSLFTMLSFFTIFLTHKIFSKHSKILIDKDFKKPQAFHTEPIARSGGLASFVSFITFILIYKFFFQTILIEFLVISTSIFIIGFLDDIKINLSPKIRLFLMIFAIYFSILFFDINLISVDLKFLEFLLDNKTFNILFILLCFLFIINGTNLIDGFNGLVGIHLLIINLILMFININSENYQIALIIIAQIIILTSFLLFNFPKAKLFLGDSGSYLFGALLVLNVINTNNSNPGISSFFFCVILFYLFFEVFFSFFRKLYLKKSPLKPDSNHLHMLTFKLLTSFKKFKDCNYLNSILINFVYLMLILPTFFFKDNGIFCRYWFFSLLIIYLIFYLKLYRFKNINFLQKNSRKNSQIR